MRDSHYTCNSAIVIMFFVTYVTFISVNYAYPDPTVSRPPLLPWGTARTQFMLFRSLSYHFPHLLCCTAQ